MLRPLIRDPLIRDPGTVDPLIRDPLIGDPVPRQRVAVLFARADSLYRSLPDVEVWDIERNALNFEGGCPVVAHPPCRAWGRLRAFARPGRGEKELALFAVEKVRSCGGVLEHPYGSTLWAAASLPTGAGRDRWGGYTLFMPQFWFGHRAEKPTLFYVVGCDPEKLPNIPVRTGLPGFVVQSRKRAGHRPHIPKSEREMTPLGMASWLVDVARRVNGSTDHGSTNQRFPDQRITDQPING